MQLDLGPVALSLLSTPDGLTIDAMRPIVADLAERNGEHWPAAWLRRLAVPVPPEVMLLHTGDRSAERTPDRTSPSHPQQAVPVELPSGRREDVSDAHVVASPT